MKLPFEGVKREVLIKKKSVSSSRHGKRPEDRSVEESIQYGVVNINKPSGPTSHQVSAYVQKILNIKKTGHSGTLDPKVTGVLPVALGKATKVAQPLLKSGKEYVAIMHIHKNIPENKIKSTVKEFVGKIRQLPPIKSAVKREWRFRTVYYLEILEIDERDVLFIVGCEAGTYIRKLISDIGKRLETGAHMTELRRTKAGPFNEESLVTLQDLQDAYIFYKEGDEKELKKIIQPVENAISHLPKVWVVDPTISSICHGASLNVPGISKIESGIETDQEVAIMSLKDELVATGRARMSSKDMLNSKKGLAVKPERVFMERDTYPKTPSAD
ncbi:RNA-guided pseudouridylation complex pseudouridine synthase subunit Cbf5 [Nanoarchaeota archaeon]